MGITSLVEWLADMPGKLSVGGSKMETSIGKSPTLGIHIGVRKDTFASSVATMKAALRIRQLPLRQMPNGAVQATRPSLSEVECSTMVYLFGVFDDIYGD